MQISTAISSNSISRNAHNHHRTVINSQITATTTQRTANSQSSRHNRLIFLCKNPIGSLRQLPVGEPICEINRDTKDQNVVDDRPPRCEIHTGRGRANPGRRARELRALLGYGVGIWVNSLRRPAALARISIASTQDMCHGQELNNRIYHGEYHRRQPSK